MAFEELFSMRGGDPRPLVAIPGKSVVKRNTLYLNASAYKTWFEKQSWVKVFWDAESRQVGLQIVHSPARNASKVGATGLTHGVISMRSLRTKAGDVWPEKTQHYELQWSDEHKMLIFDLNKPVEPEHGGRWRDDGEKK